MVIAGFAASAVLAILFVLQERRAPQPMLPLSLFGHRMFALTSLVGLLVNVAFYGLIFVFSLYFQRVNGMSPFATGLAFVPMMGAVLPVNLLAPRVAERIGAPATIAAGAALAAVRMPGAARNRTRHAATGRSCAQLIVIGAGLGLLVPPLTSTLLGSVEKSRSGIAAGVLNATRQTGSVLGVALFGSLVGQSGAFMRGAHAALIISAGLLLAAGVAIWRGASAQALAVNCASGLAQREMRAAKRHHRAETQRGQPGEHAGYRRNRAGRGSRLARAGQHQHADRDQELPHPLRNLP